MEREEYKEHLCDVIKMVFIAENNINKLMPGLRDMLKSGDVAPDRYIAMIADDILQHTPEELYKGQAYDN